MSGLPDQGYAEGYGYDPGWPTGQDDPDGPLDAQTAAIHRLCSWLSGLRFQRSGSGQVFALHRVLEGWPDETRELDGYPTASLFAPGEASSDESAPGRPEYVGSWQGYTMHRVDVLSIQLQLDIWCRHPVERQDVARMLDQERSPDEETGALVLDLPRYFDQHARFNWLRSRFWQDGDSSQKGDSRLTWMLEATVPVIRAQVYPAMQPRLHSIEIGTDPALAG